MIKYRLVHEENHHIAQTHTHTYIHTYIQRERERERDTHTHIYIMNNVLPSMLIVSFDFILSYFNMTI